LYNFIAHRHTVLGYTECFIPTFHPKSCMFAIPSNLEADSYTLTLKFINTLYSEITQLFVAYQEC